jgi:hypothetical protein
VGPEYALGRAVDGAQFGDQALLESVMQATTPSS